MNGKEQLAVDVFSHSLGFMRRHLLHHLTEVMGKQPEAETIRWIITVPAIWDENAKQFMRKAAYKVRLTLQYSIVCEDIMIIILLVNA